MFFWHHYFEKNARNISGKVAAKVGDAAATYGQLDIHANYVAKILIDNGIKPGDRVAIYGDFSIEILCAVLGIFKIGAVLVTVHHTFGVRKLIFQIQDSGACALITDMPIDPKDILACKGLQFFSLGEIFSARFAEIQRSTDAAVVDLAEINQTITDDQISAIFYTSGSTSRPKGVAVNHKNMIAAFNSVTGYLGNTANDVVLSYSTLASDYGFYNAIMPLMYGGTVVAGKALPANPKQMIDLINQHAVTAMHVFPPVIFHLLQAEGLSENMPHSLRYISSSGQILPAKHIRRLRHAWPKVKIFSNYGLTECKRVAFLPPDEIDARPGSVGKAIPGVRTYLVQQDGTLVTEPGQAGELAVAGDLLMQKYWNMPEETAARIRENIFGETRIFLTGDLFKIDVDGYLYYVARKDDVFVRNLFKVNPREIEQHLISHAAVVEAMVVPIPDEAVGNLPKAFVVLEQDANLTENELIDYCMKYLDWHMVPAAVEFVDRLPRTFSGKTAVRALS